MDNIVLASTYRLTATHFRMSADILPHDFEKRGEALPKNIRAIPFYYLISHAIELLLKCALLKRGRSADDLKKYPVTHSLNLLLQKLIELGVPLSDSKCFLRAEFRCNNIPLLTAVPASNAGDGRGQAAAV
jgi:hypothetical protein